jgi:hypothetical protein
MASGAPDWERVVQLGTPSMSSGAPDWQRVVVGEGGAPVSEPALLGSLAGYSGTLTAGTSNPIGQFHCTNTQQQLANVVFSLVVEYTTTASPTNRLILEVGGDLFNYTGSPSTPWLFAPGAVVTDAYVTVQWSGLVYLNYAPALVIFAIACDADVSGSFDGSGGYTALVWS